MTASGAAQRGEVESAFCSGPLSGVSSASATSASSATCVRPSPPIHLLVDRDRGALA
jgi:hypothetical protein